MYLLLIKVLKLQEWRKKIRRLLKNLLRRKLFYLVCSADGTTDYFMLWILVGFPFGVRKMCLWLIPKNYGLSGSIGILAFNCIIGGLIGGVVVIYRLCMAVETIIRCILVGFGQIVLKSCK